MPVDKKTLESLQASTDPVGTVETIITVLKKKQVTIEPKAKFSDTFGDAFTLKVEEQQRISSEVERLATSLQSYPDPVQMNMPPAIIALKHVNENLNIQDLPLELDRQTLRKITGKVDGKQDNAHQFTLEQVKQLFNEIADPLLMLETDNKNGVIILTSMKDLDNNPVIAAIHLNKKKGKYEFNDIASMYGKNSFDLWISKREEKIIYMNKNKSLVTSTLPSHQLQGVVENKAYAQNILTPEDIVKFFEQETAKSQVLDAIDQHFYNIEVTEENVLTVIDSIIAFLTPSDGLSDVTTAENYRWKDTAVIAGARKFISQTFADAKKEGRNIVSSDIDWDELSKDQRLAQSLITKQNIFGVVDYDALRTDGMPSNVAYLIKRVFDAVDKAPVAPLLLESQKNYVTAISNLRERLEKVRTYDEAKDEIITLSRQLVNPKYLAQYYKDNSFAERVGPLKIYETRVMSELGARFYSWIFKTGNKALHECRTGRNPNTYTESKGNNWDWLDGEPKATDDQGKATKPKKQSFQLEAAADIERVGGPSIKINSSKQLEQMFGFRGIQSGNWVLKDKSSAEFHMQATAEAMTDMADVLGIEPKYLGLNGNLALAFGARGKKGALAHYEPGAKVINITKMKGGGSLGHEYFHALDNLIQDLSTQTVGDLGFFGTRDFKKITDPDLSQAFKQLTEALTTRKNRIVYSNKYISLSKDMSEVPQEEYIRKVQSFAREIGIDQKAPFDISLKDVGQKFTSWFNEKKKTTNLYIDSFATRQIGEYLIARHFVKRDVQTQGDNVYLDVDGFNSPSDFYQKALSLDEGKVGKYWSQELEMAARSFSAYLQDRLADQGRKNDYLAYSTQGGNNRVGEIAYPQGVERVEVNAAFDELFRVIREKKVLETASANKTLMDSIFGNSIDSDIESVIDENDFIEFDTVELSINDYLAQSAATSELNQGVDPTEEQLINNDYTTGKFKINDLEIQIENPAGSTRSGIDQNGNEWQTEMIAHYGFISSTLGKDGDEIDVFVAPGTPQNYEGPFFVIYQNDETGKFDEHKTVIGVQNRSTAIKLYQDHYDENWTGLGSIVEYPSYEHFKEFLEAETAVNRSNSPAAG